MKHIDVNKMWVSYFAYLHSFTCVTFTAVLYMYTYMHIHYTCMMYQAAEQISSTCMSDCQYTYKGNSTIIIVQMLENILDLKIFSTKSKPCQLQYYFYIHGKIIVQLLSSEFTAQYSMTHNYFSCVHVVGFIMYMICICIMINN